MTFAYMYFVEKKNSFSTKSPCQRDTVPVIFKIMYFLYFLMYFSYEKKEEGWPCMYSIWASTRSSSAPITPGTEGCSSSSGGGVNLTERLCPPDVRKREQPAALPGRAAIITYAWPSLMTGTVVCRRRETGDMRQKT